MAPGVDVVVSQYCFAIYPIVAKLFGANPIIVPARNYGHDLPAMLAAITPRTKVVFVANPNNPTGTLASRAEVSAVRRRSAGARAAGDGRGVHRISGRPGGFAAADPAREETEPASHADVFKDLRPGRAAHRLWHRAAGIDRRAGKDPRSRSTSIPSRRPARWPRWTTRSTCDKTRRNNAEGLRFLNERLRADGAGIRSVRRAISSWCAWATDKRVFEEMQKQGVIVRPMGGYELPEWVRISVGTASGK